jgi:hypothetical protein
MQSPISVESIKCSKDYGFMEQDINLWDLVSNKSSFSNYNVSVTKEGTEQTLVGVGDSAVLKPQSAGIYKVNFIAKNQDYNISYGLSLYIYNPSISAYNAADFKNIILGYTDKGTITLPKIAFYFNNQKTMVSPLVKLDSANITITEKGDTVSFNADEFGKYIVTYAYEGASNVIEIKVGKMTVDFTALENNNKVGEKYVVSNFYAADAKNGNTEFIQAFVTFGGNKIELNYSNGEFYFYPTIAGKYQFEFVAKDFLGEENIFTCERQFVAVEGLSFKLSYDIASGNNHNNNGVTYTDEGVRKYLRVRMFAWLSPPIKLRAGDIFSYEVFMPNPLPGYGYLDLLQDEEPWQTLFQDNFNKTNLPELKDTDGNLVSKTTDLTAYLKDSEGRPVWYKRSIVIPNSLNGLGFADIMLSIDSTAACNNLEEIYFRNFEITASASGLTNTFFDGNLAIADSIVEGENNWSFPKVYSAVASVDVFPVIMTNQLPANNLISIGQEFVIPSKLVFDYQDGAYLPISSAVLKKQGSSEIIEANLVKYTFTEKGLYNLTITATDSDGNKLVKTIVLDVQDTFAPIIGNNAVIFKNGTVTINLDDITDNYSAKDKIKIKMHYMEPNTSEWKKVEGDSFKLKRKDVYKIRIIAEDEAGLESERIFEFSKTPRAATAGTIILISIGALVLIAGAGVGIFLFSKNKKKAAKD